MTFAALLQPKPAAIIAALVFAGFFQSLDVRFLTTPSVWLDVLVLVFWLIPALPLLLALVRFAAPSGIPPALAKSGAIAAVVFGLPLVLLYVAVMPPTAYQMSFLHGLALLLAVSASFLAGASSALGRAWVRFAYSGLVLAASAAVWSLLSVPAVMLQAGRVADGAPFCVAPHGGAAQITTLWNLRGFSFYTSKSGYKSNSGWYFHGILIVGNGDMHRYYNWSPRRLRFDEIDRPDSLIASPIGRCEPSLRPWA